MSTYDQLLKLYKVDLHRHLEGGLNLWMLWRLKRKLRPDRPHSFKSFKAACTIRLHERPGFRAFLKKFEALRFPYGSLKNLESVASHSVWSWVLNENFHHLEIRFSPVFFARRLLKGR